MLEGVLSFQLQSIKFPGNDHFILLHQFYDATPVIY